MWHRLTQALLSFIVFAAGAALAQDPYLRPPLAEREATANAAGIIPQPFLAMTNANVVDVRSGDILEGVTVVVRDGKIMSVGDDVPRGAQPVDMLGRYVTPGFFEGHFHGGTVGAAQRVAVYLHYWQGESVAEIQEKHLPIYHTLCRMVEARFFGNQN